MISESNVFLEHPKVTTFTLFFLLVLVFIRCKNRKPKAVIPSFRFFCYFCQPKLSMTIEELFRAFTDADFRYTRFMKTCDFSREIIERYDSLIESIRIQAIKMDLSPSINEDLAELGRLDLDYMPSLSWGRKFIGFLTFGLSKRRYTARTIKAYYLQEIHHRHLLVQSIQNHLVQE